MIRRHMLLAAAAVLLSGLAAHAWEAAEAETPARGFSPVFSDTDRFASGTTAINCRASSDSYDNVRAGRRRDFDFLLWLSVWRND